jgi:hypothetical protein
VTCAPEHVPQPVGSAGFMMTVLPVTIAADTARKGAGPTETAAGFAGALRSHDGQNQLAAVKRSEPRSVRLTTALR